MRKGMTREARSCNWKTVCTGRILKCGVLFPSQEPTVKCTVVGLF
jgi:hypothetical protein